MISFAKQVAAQAPTSFRVIDKHTGEFATRTTYTTRAAATKAADKLDQKYGAIRYYVKPV